VRARPVRVRERERGRTSWATAAWTALDFWHWRLHESPSFVVVAVSRWPSESRSTPRTGAGEAVHSKKRRSWCPEYDEDEVEVEVELTGVVEMGAPAIGLTPVTGWASTRGGGSETWDFSTGMARQMSWV